MAEKKKAGRKEKENREESRTAGKQGKNGQSEGKNRQRKEKNRPDGAEKKHRKRIRVNRNYKDTVFSDLFGKAENKNSIIDLYNALNGSDYGYDTEIQFTTHGDTLYMGRRNDVSFIVGNAILSMWENQSSLNENMSLRGVFYYSDQMSAYVSVHRLDIYGSKRLKIPTPKYEVLYVGDPTHKDEELKLSDLFMDPNGGCIEMKVHMINIMHPDNRKIVEKCGLLYEYTELIRAVWRFKKEGLQNDEPIDRAVAWCIENGILESYLRKNRQGVTKMLLAEYDAKLHLENEKRISYEEGEQAGVKKGEQAGIKKGEQIGIKKGEQIGIKKGEQAGIKKGEEKAGQRNRKLLEALRKIGREGEILTALDDPKKMKALYREFGIN